MGYPYYLNDAKEPPVGHNSLDVLGGDIDEVFLTEAFSLIFSCLRGHSGWLRLTLERDMVYEKNRMALDMLSFPLFRMKHHQGNFPLMKVCESWQW